MRSAFITSARAFRYELPYTRFTHKGGHTAAVEVPSPQSSFSYTWTTIASKNGGAKNNPRHTAPQLKMKLRSSIRSSTRHGCSQRRPMDAGDYSKYTINSRASDALADVLG